MLAVVLSKLGIPSGERGTPTATAPGGATIETDPAFLVGNK